MNIEITILGLLMEGNLYGYEIKKKISDILDDYADIKFGSIYYAIKKALENGWLKKVGTEKDSGNPERYIYEILPAGRKYYKKILKQYFDKRLIHFDIDIALMFYRSLSPEQREQFIEDRISLIQERLESMNTKIQNLKELPSAISSREMLSYIFQHLKAEMAWLKSLPM